MTKVIVGVSLLLALVAGCGDTRTTCYGIEPDGEVEKLRPCPPGWKDKETRIIKEDEFRKYEVTDLKRMKDKSKGGF